MPNQPVLDKSVTKTVNRKRQDHRALKPVVRPPGFGEDVRSACGYIAPLMRKICKRAGVTPFGFHSIRHLFASKLWRQDVSLGHIQQLLRHKSPRVTERYLQSLGLEKVRKSLELTFNPAIKESPKMIERSQNKNPQERFPEGTLVSGWEGWKISYHNLLILFGVPNRI